MTSQEIEVAVAYWFGLQTHIIIPNLSYALLSWECDLAVLTNAGYLYEIEIKVSKADLIRDAKKHKWHNYFYYHRMRKLWFAIPEALTCCAEHIPRQAGILLVADREYADAFGKVTEFRKPIIDTEAKKLTPAEKFRLARTGVFRMWNLKLSALNGRKSIMEKAI